MTAHCAIDWAGRLARAAADAAQHVAELAFQKSGPSVVHQHQVEFLRPVQIAVAPRASGEGGVAGDFLSRCRSGKKTDDAQRIFHAGQHFFDGRQNYVHPGQGLGQIAVAFVGDDDDRPGFRDQHVGAGDADIGGKELFT